MNERIRELAKQAKAFIVEPEQAKIGEVSEVSFDKYSDLEKFVELIIRECAYIPINMWDKAELNADVAVKIEDSIKAHFGVEE